MTQPRPPLRRSRGRRARPRLPRAAWRPMAGTGGRAAAGAVLIRRGSASSNAIRKTTTGSGVRNQGLGRHPAHPRPGHGPPGAAARRPGCGLDLPAQRLIRAGRAPADRRLTQPCARLRKVQGSREPCRAPRVRLRARPRRGHRGVVAGAGASRSGGDEAAAAAVEADAPSGVRARGAPGRLGTGAPCAATPGGPHCPAPRPPDSGIPSLLEPRQSPVRRGRARWARLRARANEVLGWTAAVEAVPARWERLGHGAGSSRANGHGVSSPRPAARR